MKDFKLSRYYDVEIEKDGFSTENIYDEGKVTIKSVSPLPENAMFLTGVYRDDILVKVYQSDQAQFEINAQDGERIKVFLWGNDGLIPLTDGVVTADKIADVSNNGKNLLYNYEKENPNSGFKFDEISNQSRIDINNKKVYYDNIEKCFYIDGRQIDATASVADNKKYGRFFEFNQYFTRDIFENVFSIIM